MSYMRKSFQLQMTSCITILIDLLSFLLNFLLTDLNESLRKKNLSMKITGIFILLVNIH